MTTSRRVPAGCYLPEWPVGFQEVGLQKDVKQVACHAFDGVVDGQHVDPLAILHVCALHSRRHCVSGRKVVAWLQHVVQMRDFICPQDSAQSGVVAWADDC